MSIRGQSLISVNLRPSAVRIVYSGAFAARRAVGLAKAESLTRLVRDIEEVDLHFPTPSSRFPNMNAVPPNR